MYRRWPRPLHRLLQSPPRESQGSHDPQNAHRHHSSLVNPKHHRRISRRSCRCRRRSNHGHAEAPPPIPAASFQKPTPFPLLLLKTQCPRHQNRFPPRLGLQSHLSFVQRYSMGQKPSFV
uniref:Uncharacterized protein n=1 Tax=Rhizophora mucronata TaxID=61149 RepID=A0A2P2PMF4_RHIMU